MSSLYIPKLKAGGNNKYQNFTMILFFVWIAASYWCLVLKICSEEINFDVKVWLQKLVYNQLDWRIGSMHSILVLNQ